MELKSQLIPKLKALRLSGVLETLEVRNKQAIEEKFGIEFLQEEIEDMYSFKEIIELLTNKL